MKEDFGPLLGHHELVFLPPEQQRQVEAWLSRGGVGEPPIVALGAPGTDNTANVAEPTIAANDANNANNTNNANNADAEDADNAKGP